MKLFLMLFGFVCLNLGIILALHFDFTIGLLVSAYGVCTFWLMLPMHSDQNERLRRYEQQHQKWLRGKNDL